MFRSKRQQEILESTESKLAKMFEEMNTEKRPDTAGPYARRNAPWRVSARFPTLCT